MSTPIGSSQWMYATGAEVTQQSLKFNDDESQYLSWTPAAAGNRKTWTWSAWVKRGNLGGTQMLFTSYDGTNGTELRYVSGGASGVADSFQLSSFAGGYYQKTLPVHRDPSAWGQLVVSVDTTQATASDRVKIYFNGVQLANDGTTNIPQNYDTHINNNIKHTIGNRAENNTLYFDGYLSDVYFIDGQALDPTSFGQFTDGYWEAIDYAGTYGTNGFHLTFQDDVVSEGFNTVTYRGTGASQSVSGLGLEADLVWIKQRSGTAFHNVYDSLRIVGGDHKRLYTNATNAEESSTYSGTTNLTSLDGDGFSLGTGTDTNNSGSTYVAWAWDAGSGSPVSNTDGSITSSVKANPSYGFSIVTWTATTGTVGHGLGTAPELIIEKRRSSTSDWIVGTTAIDGSNDYLRLNTTVGKTDSASASPTATVFTPNTGSGDVVAYCFHSVAGYSSIGSFTGTGAAGNAVTCGFRPAFVMIKRTDSTANWHIFDNTRDSNGNLTLFPNLSNAESSGWYPDYFKFTSNGFEVGSGGTQTNASGGTYIYMAFADTREAAFWKDVSGQGNHWTPNNLDYRDSLIDSPANNFATFNPLMYRSISNTTTLSEGNLKSTGASGFAFGTINIPTSGKWHFETYTVAGTSVGAVGVGDGNLLQNNNLSDVVYYLSNGDKFVNGTFTSYGATWTTGDVIGVACDADSGTVTFYKNGSSQGSISYDPSGATVFFINWGTTGYFVLNSGQDSTFSGTRPAGGNQDDNGIGDFAYPVPSGGYLALCSANLPTPTIVDGSTAFSTVLYTGDGTNSNSVTGVGHAPDFVWFKRRDAAGYYHELHDTIRGADKALFSNATDAESTRDSQISFDSDGFTVGTQSGAHGGTNASGGSYVAWNWKAGGTAVSNTDGSITSQVSANVDAGFSIVSYTRTSSGSDTIGHGLGQKPSVVIYKSRSTGSWYFTHELVDGSYDFLTLNTTDANSNITGASPPTSSVFSNTLFGASENFIAYCFANSDIIKAGSYTGNGSADGPFVYTGGRVAWVMIKRTDSAYDWPIQDGTTNSHNVVNKTVYANLSDAENSYDRMDFLSNGFKLRNTFVENNASGGTYIYLAFAENPFKYANAR